MDKRARLEFDYRLIRVWEFPVEAVLAGGLATLPSTPIAAVATGILMTLKDRRSLVAGLLQGTRAIVLYQGSLSEGRLEGRVEGERSLLLRQGGHKFRPADPAVRARIDAGVDSGGLDRLGVALLTATTWEQLSSAGRFNRRR